MTRAKSLKIILNITGTILAATSIIIAHVRDAKAQGGGGWQFGDCYNAGVRELGHDKAVTICNCMMRIGSSFNYDMRASTNFCISEYISQVKQRQNANAQQLMMQMLPGMMQVPSYNQNSSGAIDALGRAFGLPSANSVTCRPIYGYDGSYQGTRCQ